MFAYYVQKLFMMRVLRTDKMDNLTKEQIKEIIESVEREIRDYCSVCGCGEEYMMMLKDGIIRELDK